jgi:ribosome-binding ATPase YchF (GTP1/OBG family)
LAQRALTELNAGRPARMAAVAPDEDKAWRMLQLLTAKPVLLAANVDEASAAGGNALSEKVAARGVAEGAGCVVVSARIESEIALLPAAERGEFLDHLGLAEPGLDRLIHQTYALLGLMTFFTAGPKEARAWTVAQGATAPEADGVIHGDFEKGFIRAETIAYDDFVRCGGEAGAREAGKLRSEGRDYVVREGDVMHFRFNV